MIDKKDDAFLGQNIKGMMMTLIAHWNAQIDDARAETEFAKIRPADMQVFAQLRGRIVKLSNIHREMGFSRQAGQQAVDRLVSQDMITVEPAPDNKRDKVVTITEKGQRWRTIAALQIRQIEDQITLAIGEDSRESLRKSLNDLIVTSASEHNRF
jgi:DNA-binding MarR family transcriptional regulator